MNIVSGDGIIFHQAVSGVEYAIRSDGPGTDQLAADCGDGIGEPHEHSTPALPRLGEVVRDVERLLAQATAVLKRPVDPASEPTVVACPAISDDVMVHRLLLGEVAVNLYWALRKLGKVAALPMPPVGSAVKIPARSLDDVDRTDLDEPRLIVGDSADEQRDNAAALFDADESSGLPPASVAPVAPGRGVGPRGDRPVVDE
jgi:hypothetical protein